MHSYAVSNAPVKGIVVWVQPKLMLFLVVIQFLLLVVFAVELVIASNSRRGPRAAIFASQTSSCC